MRYPASEKLEIIRVVERSHLPAKRTLDKLGIPKTTFYRWYDRYLSGGAQALADRTSMPSRVWNRIADAVRGQLVNLALECLELDRISMAVRYIDTQGYFVSESSVYRLLKAHDLITSPAFIVIKAASEFADKTTAINQMWQIDFTYFKIIGWGWMYLSTILDDFSRYIIAWKLCTTMKTSDVTQTLELALQASGCDQAHVRHKPRLLSDNGASYISGGLADWIKDKGMSHVRVRHTTHKLRARSSVGIKHSRAASCWKTTSCRETCVTRSPASSITITTGAITSPYATLPPLTSTSDADNQS